MDNFKAIYRILRYLEKAMDYDEPDMEAISAEALGITKQRWAALLEMLVRSGYIDGVSVKRSTDGTFLLSVSLPRVTLSGLEYLKENSMMRKAANIAKGIADVIP